MVTAVLASGRLTDIDVVNPRGRAAFLLAAMRGRPALMRVLMDAGAAVDGIDGRARNAFHFALTAGRNDTDGQAMVEMLLQWPGWDRYAVGHDLDEEAIGRGGGRGRGGGNSGLLCLTSF